MKHLKNRGTFFLLIAFSLLTSAHAEWLDLHYKATSGEKNHIYIDTKRVVCVMEGTFTAPVQVPPVRVITAPMDGVEVVGNRGDSVVIVESGKDLLAITVDESAERIREMMDFKAHEK